VHSFDYDPQSVACTEELRRRYFSEDQNWTVQEASVLNWEYLAKLGIFDVVYSWGVLHHTGSMWAALGNTARLVAPGGKLFIAIYNDQGVASQWWTRLKRFYNRAPRPIQWLTVVVIGLYLQTRSILGRLARGENPFRLASRSKPSANKRGMSIWFDLIDWVGGYPFEVAKPEQIFDFLRERGFALARLKTCAGGLGCNEYVFVRGEENQPPQV
jgi:2-polyprenyl-6-hydroxyphenyl methylase/3-demethylubiquinone-9 3-methyltransferase